MLAWRQTWSELYYYNDLNYINKERNFAVTFNRCAFNSYVLPANVESYSFRCTAQNLVESLKRKVNDSELIAYCSCCFNL